MSDTQTGNKRVNDVWQRRNLHTKKDAELFLFQRGTFACLQTLCQSRDGMNLILYTSHGMGWTLYNILMHPNPAYEFTMLNFEGKLVGLRNKT